jgi:transposase
LRLLVERRSAVDVRREALVQLRSVIVTAPDQLREELRRLPTGALIQRCRRLRRPGSLLQQQPLMA